MGKQENVCWNIVECACRILGVSTATGKLRYVFYLIIILYQVIYMTISDSARAKNFQNSSNRQEIRFRARLRCLKTNPLDHQTFSLLINAAYKITVAHIKLRKCPNSAVFLNYTRGGGHLHTAPYTLLNHGGEIIRCFQTMSSLALKSHQLQTLRDMCLASNQNQACASS